VVEYGFLNLLFGQRHARSPALGVFWRGSAREGTDALFSLEGCSGKA